MLVAALLTAPMHACSPTAIITALFTARALWLVCSLIVGLFGVHENLWTTFVATTLLMEALSSHHPTCSTRSPESHASCLQVGLA